jgi:hypothetical protein
MTGVDEGVREVDGSRLDLPTQELIGVLDEELLESVVAGDEDPQALALTSAGPAPLLPQAAMVPGYPTVMAASRRRCRAAQRTGLTTRSCPLKFGLYGAALLGVAGAVGERRRARSASTS